MHIICAGAFPVVQGVINFVAAPLCLACMHEFYDEINSTSLHGWYDEKKSTVVEVGRIESDG